MTETPDILWLLKLVAHPCEMPERRQCRATGSRALLTTSSPASLAGAAVSPGGDFGLGKGLFLKQRSPVAAGDIGVRGKKVKVEGHKLITEEYISKADGKCDRRCARFGFPTKPSLLGEPPAAVRPPHIHSQCRLPSGAAPACAGHWTPSHLAEQAVGRRRRFALGSLTGNDEKRRGWGKQQRASRELPASFLQLLLN